MALYTTLSSVDIHSKAAINAHQPGKSDSKDQNAVIRVYTYKEKHSHTVREGNTLHYLAGNTQTTNHSSDNKTWILLDHWQTPHDLQNSRGEKGATREATKKGMYRIHLQMLLQICGNDGHFILFIVWHSLLYFSPILTGKYSACSHVHISL